MMRPPQMQVPGMQPGMTVPMLPSLPQAGMGSYPNYPQGLPSQHASYSSRSISGPGPMMYSPQYMQQQPVLHRQASYPQPGNPPTFAFDVNTAIPSQGFPGPISSMSDPGAPPTATDYSTPSSRPFTAETLNTPFFPDLSSPVFQEAARALMNDEHKGQMYQPYTQQPQFSRSNAPTHSDAQISPTQAFQAQPSYGPSYGVPGHSAAASTLPPEFPVDYSSHRSVSQPSGSGHGYPTNPPSSSEGGLGYRRPSNAQ